MLAAETHGWPKRLAISQQLLLLLLSKSFKRQKGMRKKMPLNICLIDSKILTPWPWECKSHNQATSAACTLFSVRICNYHNQQEATPLLYGKTACIIAWVWLKFSAILWCFLCRRRNIYSSVHSSAPAVHVSEHTLNCVFGVCLESLKAGR